MNILIYFRIFFFITLIELIVSSINDLRPRVTLVVNTWGFSNATRRGKFLQVEIFYTFLKEIRGYQFYYYNFKAGKFYTKLEAVL